MSEYYMMNKPQGCITAKCDERRKTVMEYLPYEMRASLHPVGRLDIDTEGLLLFTDDGRLDHALLMPEHHVEKSYFFYAIGTLCTDSIEKIKTGLYLSGFDKITKPADITDIKPTTVGKISEFLPEKRRERYLKNPDGEAFSAVLTISEGRKHQVKLMLRAIGCKIIYLKRTAFAGLLLDENLKNGEWRALTGDERENLLCRVESCGENKDRQTPDNGSGKF